MLGADDRNEVPPVPAPDVQVEQHEVDLLLAQELAREIERGRLEYPVVLELEVDTAQHAQRRVVLDDENRRHLVSRRPLRVDRHTHVSVDR